MKLQTLRPWVSQSGVCVRFKEAVLGEYGIMVEW
jgi:hypothetical protein